MENWLKRENEKLRRVLADNRHYDYYGQRIKPQTKREMNNNSENLLKHRKTKRRKEPSWNSMKRKHISTVSRPSWFV